MTDVRRIDLRELDALFAPRTVAVIGTDPRDRVERIVLNNLLGVPSRAVFAVDAGGADLPGVSSYLSIAAAPAPIDLAILVAPAPKVPRLIGECVDAHVKGAIILSAGFREIGAAGEQLESEILAHARRGGLRIVGPNSLGVMNTATGLNAGLARQMARRGHVAFVSQSGALGAAVLDWGRRENVGLSAFVSVGSMLDVGWGELVEYLSDDPQTRVILLYMESLGDARAFASAARSAALTKPIILLKAGRTESAARAAASHTGALAGGDAVLDAIARRCGLVRVHTLGDLFHMAEVLEKQPRPPGPRLTIVTNAGGPGVMAADALVAAGGELSDLAVATLQSLDAALPPQWSRANPIDLLDEADDERYARVMEIVSQDPNSDGFLVIHTPQVFSHPNRTAELLQPSAGRFGKPVLASWMGAAQAEAGEEILSQAGVPNFRFPDTAARLFGYTWRYTYNLRGIYETPAPPGEGERAPDRARAEAILHAARQAGRTLLAESESKEVLSAYGIPCVTTRVAAGEDEAVQIAGEIGFPVVLKIHSETISHKMDLGGVELDLRDAEAVRRAFRAIRIRGGAHFLGVTVQPMIAAEGYELVVGSRTDPQVGPVLLFGAGGALVDVLEDTALGLAPLNTTLARRMMEQTRIYRALRGALGRPPVDLAALEQLMVRFSQLVMEQRWIREIDVNPLFVSPAAIRRAGDGERGLAALDARVILHPSDTRAEDLPGPLLRPYPTQYVRGWTGSRGLEATIRPIRPEDEPMVAAFHTTLSDRTVFLRYMHILTLSQRIAHERLTRICFDDYDREIALVAERANPAGPAREIVAIGRMSKLRRRNEAEFAILVGDPYQGHGLGTELLSRLLEVGRAEKQERVIGFVASENAPMLRICSKFGFRLHRPPGETEVEAVLEL